MMMIAMVIVIVMGMVRDSCLDADSDGDNSDGAMVMAIVISV